MYNSNPPTKINGYERLYVCLYVWVDIYVGDVLTNRLIELKFGRGT